MELSIEIPMIINDTFESTSAKESRCQWWESRTKNGTKRICEMLQKLEVVVTFLFLDSQMLKIISPKRFAF
jgi:hypothetical protein